MSIILKNTAERVLFFPHFNADFNIKTQNVRNVKGVDLDKFEIMHFYANQKYQMDKNLKGPRNRKQILILYLCIRTMNKNHNCT